MDTFVMLEELLEQDQFELLPAKEGDTERRLVYLMNDAVESFLADLVHESGCGQVCAGGPAGR